MLRSFPKPVAKPDGSVSTIDRVTVLMLKAIAEAQAELLRADHASGRVIVAFELHIVNGSPRWHSSSIHFADHYQYPKEA